MAQAPLDQAKIADVLLQGMTPRSSRISTYQRYFDGTVYDGKPGFLDAESDKPLTERAPCVVFPGVRNAVNAFSSMCLGDKRFPSMTTLTNEDDSVFDERLGLKPDESEIFDAFLAKLSEQARLPAKAQQIIEVAMTSGTAVPMAAVIKGKLAIKQLDPKVCWPEFDGDGVTLNAVEERYLYEESVWSKEERVFQRRVFMYRRRIDAKHDIVFKPYEVTKIEDVPACLLFPTESPYETKEKTKFEHNFGFCPVLWYRFLETVSDASQIDGRPIHWGLLSLCDAVNFGLSQRFRAGLYCGFPQTWESGVDEDNPVNAPQGRLSSAKQPTAGLEGWAGSSRTSGTMTARKRGPNEVWTYGNPEAKVGMLTMTGDSLKPLGDDIADNRRTLRESLGHVELDVTALSKSELSGAAIEEMKAPQIAVANKIREDFGANCLLPLVNLLLRVAYHSSEKGGLYLAGIKKARPILEKFYQEIGSDTAPANDTSTTAEASVAPAGAGAKKLQWFEPTIKLAWGAYSETSDTEQQTRVTMVAMAHEKGFITRKTAVMKIRDIFPDIGNVDLYLDTLLKGIAKAKADEDARMQDHIGALHEVKAKAEGDGDGGSGDKPAADPATPAPDAAAA